MRNLIIGVSSDCKNRENIFGRENVTNQLLMIKYISTTPCGAENTINISL